MSDSSSPLHSAKMAPILKVLGDRFPEYDKDRLTAFIVCKNVLVDGQLCTDPKAKISPGVPIRFTFDKFVSRGGLSSNMRLHNGGSMFLVW